MSTFYRYLWHVEGGAHSKEQALIHVRQVHTVLEILEKNGEDISCLTKHKCMDIWDIFAAPRSLEMFSKFIDKGLFYDQKLLSTSEKTWLVSLSKRLPEYRATIHRRSAADVTKRKVEEAYSQMTVQDLRDFRQSDIAKDAIKTLGMALEHHVPTRNEFTNVRDYLLVTTLFENGSRPGVLESAKLGRFEKAIYTPATSRWTILVDDHKTTRHQGPAELSMDNRLYGYIKIYINYIWPAYVISALEDAIFITEEGEQFGKGRIGRRVTEIFQRANIRPDINVTATRIRKLHATKAAEFSPTKKQSINRHMKHMPATADRSYVIKVNAEKASRAHQLTTHHRGRGKGHNKRRRTQRARRKGHNRRIRTRQRNSVHPHPNR